MAKKKEINTVQLNGKTVNLSGGPVGVSPRHHGGIQIQIQRTGGEGPADGHLEDGGADDAEGGGKEMNSRQYIASDLKSFYASVECQEFGKDPLTTNLVVADKSRTDRKGKS